MKEKTMEEEKNIEKKEITNISNAIEEKATEKPKEFLEIGRASCRERV